MLKEKNQKYGNFTLGGIYLLKSLCFLILGISHLVTNIHERVIKRYPLAVVAFVVIVSTIIGFISVSKVRTERDFLTKKVYRLEQVLQKNGMTVHDKY